MSLIMVDLDGLKKINSTRGFEKSDQILKDFAKVLSTKVRSSDILARWEGGTFIVLCRETDVAKALETTKIMHALLNTQPPFTPIELTASFAISSADEVRTHQALILLAEMRLFEAKNTSKNKIVYDA